MLSSGLVALASCDFRGAEGFAQCFGEGLGRGIGQGIGSSFQETFGPFGDWAARGGPDAGFTLRVSARNPYGRLSLEFEGPVVSGTVPRMVTPPPEGQCRGLEDTLIFREDLGASNRVHQASATVTINDFSDAGIELDLLDVTYLEPDGGVVNLPSQRVSLSF